METSIYVILGSMSYKEVSAGYGRNNISINEPEY